MKLLLEEKEVEVVSLLSKIAQLEEKLITVASSRNEIKDETLMVLLLLIIILLIILIIILTLIGFH
jgi:hypothetical protein